MRYQWVQKWFEIVFLFLFLLFLFLYPFLTYLCTYLLISELKKIPREIMICKNLKSISNSTSKMFLFHWELREKGNSLVFPRMQTNLYWKGQGKKSALSFYLAVFVCKKPRWILFFLATKLSRQQHTTHFN